MLSVLIYGRNDAYGGTAQRRSALSINALAEMLADDDEIVFVDYNTDDHKLTFAEAIADTLTTRAQRLVRVVRVRPHHHAQLSLPGALPVVESIARNIGLRHTNPANRWVLSTNPDIILLPPAAGLHALLRELDDGYYAAPRFELPRMLWQRLPRQDPAAVQTAVARFAAALHLDEEVRHYLPAVGFDAPGDFQLVLRGDLMAVGGFDERMQRPWHVDANLMARLGLQYGAPGSLAGKLRIYHCEHTADTMAKHSAGRSEDCFETFVSNVQSGLANAGWAWGGKGLKFEEFALAGALQLETAHAVGKVIGTPQTQTYQAAYGPESFDRVERRDAHTLTFVIDRVFPLARTARLLWIGCAGDLRAQVQQALERIGFVHPLLDADNRGAIAAADLVLLDNPPPAASPAEIARIEAQVGALVTAETERRDQGESPRQLIAINAVHNHLEAFLIDRFDVVLCPFTTRLRPALIRNADAGLGSWLGDLSVGDAGERAAGDNVIIIRPSRAGHVFYGPYRRLSAGHYRARVDWAAQGDKTAGRLVLEVVQGETFLAQKDCSLAGSVAGGRDIDFIIKGTSRLIAGEPVQIRLWTDGTAAGSVTAVAVTQV